jgi:hypothetical protein
MKEVEPLQEEDQGKPRIEAGTQATQSEAKLEPHLHSDEQSIWDSLPKCSLPTPYVDLSVEPAEDEHRAFLKGIPVAEDGDLIVLSARLKSFKSSVVAALACSTSDDRDTDCLGFNIKGNGVFLIFDTEQSENEIRTQAKAMRQRLGVDTLPNMIKVIGLRDYTPSDRMLFIKDAIVRNIHHGIVAMAIDGVSDLCRNPNDIEESSAVVNFLTVAASKSSAPLFGVIHLNHGDRDAAGGGRGHLGKEMERKAKSVLCIEKDKEGVGTIYAATTRKQSIPKEHGQRIGFSQSKMMVVSLEDTAAEVKEAEKVERLKEMLYRIQGRTDMLSWKYNTFIAELMEDGEKCSDATAKRRRKSMLDCGILKHDGSTGILTSLLKDRLTAKNVKNPSPRAA